MTAIVWDPKDPLEQPTCTLDWSGDLAPGDTVAASTWAIITTDGALAIVASNAFTATATQVKTSGGTSGINYELRNSITTASGDELVAVVMLPVRAKT